MIFLNVDCDNIPVEKCPHCDKEISCMSPQYLLNLLSNELTTKCIHNAQRGILVMPRKYLNDTKHLTGGLPAVIINVVQHSDLKFT